jgi:hypothetical protein
MQTPNHEFECGAEPSSKHEKRLQDSGFGSAFAAPPLNSTFGGRKLELSWKGQQSAVAGAWALEAIG